MATVPTAAETHAALLVAKKEEAIIRLNKLLPILKTEQIEALSRIVASCPNKQFDSVLAICDSAVRNPARDVLEIVAELMQSGLIRPELRLREPRP